MKFEEPNALNDVAAFHKTFRLPVPESPGLPSDDRCQLRINLLQEELDELKDAIAEKDLVGIADALADLQYVLSGAVLEFGLGSKFKEIFDEVQRSNMSKVCQDHNEALKTIEHYIQRDGTIGFIEESDGKYLVYRQTDKKVLKSVGYSSAQLAEILVR